MNGFVWLLSLLFTGSTSPAHASCDACNLQLQQRAASGAYRLVATATLSQAHVLRIKVRLVNRSRLVARIGESTETDLFFNSITPVARGIEVVPTDSRERHAVSVPPGATAEFSVVYPYALTRPGTYRFNFSYHGTDSNTVRYTVPKPGKHDAQQSRARPRRSTGKQTP